MILRGLEPAVGSSEEFARFLADYRTAAALIVKEAGIAPQ